WEEQVLSAGDQEIFRNFFRGETVSRVRSLECSHVSEMVEEFNVVPVTVKGHRSLQD
ncbi:hypothetical protein K402DRAFT_306427, partial [Aulographum hederae CBS 113979]